MGCCCYLREGGEEVHCCGVVGDDAPVVGGVVLCCMCRVCRV